MYLCHARSRIGQDGGPIKYACANTGANIHKERPGWPYLGEVPLAIAIREMSDAGRPIVVAEPNGPHAEAYLSIARRLSATLESSRARPVPRIVME